MPRSAVPFAARVLHTSCLIAFTCLSTTRAAAQTYTITAIEPSVAGYETIATSMNTRGEVAGVIYQFGGNTRGFLLSDGLLTELPTFGGYEGAAYGINDSGVVVGGTGGRAFRYAHGELQDLGPNTAYGINRWGDIVGQAGSHASLWQGDGQIVLTEPPGFVGATATALNDHGHIVGQMLERRISPEIGERRFAFVFQDGTMRDLGLPAFSSATFINNAGQIVGTLALKNVAHAMLFSDGRITDLGTLGGPNSLARGINETGDIVGYADKSSSPGHAFLYRAGRMFDLNDLIPPNSDWELTVAAAINLRGQIVGTGLFNHQWRAFILTPTSFSIPGRIESENFDSGENGVAYHDVSPGNEGGAYRQTDVDIAEAAEGGFTIGWAEAPEWQRYTVDVRESGDYRMDVRVASLPPGGTFHVEFQDSDVSGPLTIPATGDWQAWQTVSARVHLTAGRQVMRVVLDTNAEWGGVGNFNWIQFTRITGAPLTGAPAPIPGVIEAEHFDLGPDGVAYHDTTPENLGRAFRETGVDVAEATEGGYTVGWANAPEWLAYTVDVEASGPYLLELLVASLPPGGTFHVEFGNVDVTGVMTVPETGDWQAWQVIAADHPVILEAGVQTMRLVLDTNQDWGGVGNFNWIRLTPTSSDR